MVGPCYCRLQLTPIDEEQNSTSRMGRRVVSQASLVINGKCFVSFAVVVV